MNFALSMDANPISSNAATYEMVYKDHGKKQRYRNPYFPGPNFVPDSLLSDGLEHIESKRKYRESFQIISNLLFKFRYFGYTSSPFNEPMKISDGTLITSLKVLNILKKEEKDLPKVCPDENESLEMIWESENKNKYSILNIENNKLFMVISEPNLPARYYEDIIFEQNGLPIELFQFLRSI